MFCASLAAVWVSTAGQCIRYVEGSARGECKVLAALAAHVQVLFILLVTILPVFLEREVFTAAKTGKQMDCHWLPFQLNHMVG